MRRLLDRQVLLVAGKGGVGRSTVSAAFARAGAQRGRRVLLCEVGEPSRQEASPLAGLFGKELLPDSPEALADGVDGVTLSTERGTELFLAAVFRVPALARLALRNATLLRLLHAGPSFHEMGIFNHLLWLSEARSGPRPRWDQVIVDLPATGHALALTALPDLLLRLVPGGPIGRRLREGQALFNDASRTAAAVVTLPEPLPVSEGLELVAGLEATRVPVGGVLVNRLPARPLTQDQRERLEAWTRGRPTWGMDTVRRQGRADAALERLRSRTRHPVHLLTEQPEEGARAVEGLTAELLALAG